MLDQSRLSLHSGMFSMRREVLWTQQDLTLETSTFTSGVESVTLSIGSSQWIWLPFLGSQVWDWSIDGVSQKFSGFVSEPAYGLPFLENYGAFLIHCGITAMGNPGIGDTHAHHGELSTARFDRAWIEFTNPSSEFPVALCSELTVHIPFKTSYRFEPRLQIHRSGRFAIMTCMLENRFQSPLPYMYLAHINFRYPDQGKLSYQIESFNQETVTVLHETIKGITENPSLVFQLGKERNHDPEFVGIMDHGRHARPTVPGNSHMISSLHMDSGQILWVASRTVPLDHTVIWITHNKDRGACGFALPATAGPRGKSAEQALGNLKYLAAKETIHMTYAFGYALDTLENDITKAVKSC